MGKCTVCGKNYCNCPGNGICAACAAKQMEQLKGGITVTGPCGFTSDEITELRDFAISLRSGNMHIRMGLTEPTVNMYIGYAVSAWNYRHEPCRYESELRKLETLRKLYAIQDKVTV